MDDGIVPTSEFWSSNKYCNAVNAPMAAGIEPAIDFFDNVMEVIIDPTDPVFAGAHEIPVHVHHDPGAKKDCEQFQGNFNDDTVGIARVMLHNAYACVVVAYCLLLINAVTSLFRGAPFVAPCSNCSSASKRKITNTMCIRDIVAMDGTL